jgi:DNA transformation protein
VKTDSFKDFVLDQLRDVGAVEWRAMFGGFGLYRGTKMFGIIFKGRLYFKINARSRPDYEAHGMGHFRPSARQALKSFYEVPANVIESATELDAWAVKAIESAA